MISGYQGEIWFMWFHLRTFKLAIYQHADESYAITLMRRMMMRIASGLAQKTSCASYRNRRVGWTSS